MFSKFEIFNNLKKLVLAFALPGWLFQSFYFVAAWQRGRVAANKISNNFDRGKYIKTPFHFIALCWSTICLLRWITYFKKKVQTSIAIRLQAKYYIFGPRYLCQKVLSQNLFSFQERFASLAAWAIFVSLFYPYWQKSQFLTK